MKKKARKSAARVAAEDEILRWRLLPGNDFDMRYWDELRRRCQTDLFFLAKHVLGYSDVSEEAHREVALFFVQKDPDLTIREQDSIKGRLLLMPRGTFKTTFNIADTVQWTVTFPDIGMLVLTAANSEDSPLADAFVDEVATHFYQQPGTEPTLFHLLFPEHVITKMPKKSWFVTPARRKSRREPTLMGASIEQSLSGWHFDVIKPEDIQDNRNSQTAAGIRKVKKNLFINLKMLMSWGYRIATGTRYGPTDVYGLMIEHINPRLDKILWKPGMEVKPEVFKKNPKLKERAEDYLWLADNLKEKDWKIFFPAFLSYQNLIDSRNVGDGGESFLTQHMNIATGNFKSLFPKELLKKISLSSDVLPIAGEPFCKWRFELGDSTKQAGAAGVLDNGRIYVLEVVSDELNPSMLAESVVNLARRHHCPIVTIEETPGARYMEGPIRNEALRQAYALDIRWTEYQKDESERNLRIKSCEPTMANGRLFFNGDMTNLSDVHYQMYLYGRLEDTEIPDVISRMCEELPKTIARQEEDGSTDDVLWELLAQRDQHDRLYGLGAYKPQEPAPPLETELDDWEPDANPFGLEEMMPGLEN